MTDNQHRNRLAVEDILLDPDQPRKTFCAEALSGLSRSLLETGQISPIVVRPGSEGKYIIVVGERRWRAAREAGLSHVECVIRYDINEQKAREMQFAENFQREDIPPLEQARSYKSHLERYKASQSELSRRTGIPQRTISDRLALLSLPPSVHARLEKGEMGPYEATQISKLAAGQQEAVAEAVACGRIGGRALEKLVKLARAAPGKSVRGIIEELAAQQHVPISPPITAEPSNTNRASTLQDKMDISPETVSLKEQTGEARTNRKPPVIEVSSEIDMLVAAAKELGGHKQKECPNLGKVGCSHWSWQSEESIPHGIGEPVQDGQWWRVMPSPLFCAMCNMHSSDLEERVFELEYGAFHPLSGVQVDFKCNCGSEYYLAALVKCTKCGQETWWGHWPED